MALFSQDITIDDLNYTCFILNKDSNNYELIISGNGAQYSCNIPNNAETFETLTSSIREKVGLKCLYFFEDNNTILKITIIHQTIKLNICYTLKIVEKDFSFNTIVYNRLKKLENKHVEIYPLNDKLFGPCVIIPDDSYMKPESIYARLYELNKSSENNNDFINSLKIYNNEIPTCSKNQFFFNGIKTFKSNIPDIMLSNSYTLFTKKYENNIVGLIEKYENIISINFASKNFKINYDNISFVRDTYHDRNIQFNKFTTKDFFENGYLFKLPFNVNDGIYLDRHSHPYIVKNNKIYNIENLKSDGFIISPDNIETLNNFDLYLEYFTCI